LNPSTLVSTVYLFKMPLDPPFSVTVHPYRAPVRGVVAYEMGASGSRNALVFVGGLTDGPHTSPFIRVVARHLEKASNLGYSVFEVRMRSSFTGFGTSSLANDVEDISALVKYLRSIGKEKIVLLGTSTGCQDCMEYADYTKHENLPVEGFILHAPVSDREALEMVFPDNQESIDLARSMIAEGKQDDCLPQDMVPSVLEAPISAYRFNSLCAKGGDDDYFSSDLDDAVVAKFWSRFKQPVLVLHSAEDEFIPEHVDQVALNKRYRDANPNVSSLSGLIPGTGHTVREPEARELLAQKVAEFLETV
jgi:pimeloyl-ACP methyl ester carboxylesterase